MTFPYTNECIDNCILRLEPVPGAIHFPKRLVCVTHGYPGERRTTLVPNKSEGEKPNDYVTEVASPADIQEIGGNQVSVY